MPADPEKTGVCIAFDDAGLDPDGDGKTNLEEFKDGTNPRVHPLTPAAISVINGILLDDDD